MNRTLSQYLSILAIIALVAANSALSFAAEDFEDGEITFTTTEIEESTEEDFEEETVDPEKEVKIEEQFLLKIQQELNLSKADYHQLLNRINDTKNRLRLVSEERLSLKEQIKNLETQEALTTEKLLAVLRQITERENEIIWLYSEIEIREEAIKIQKNLLKDYIRLIYQEENELFTFTEDDEVEAFKMLLSDGTVGENLKKLEYFNLLNEAGQQIVSRLDILHQELESRKAVVISQKYELDDLKNELATEREQLQIQKAAKEKLLSMTEGQESVYEELLDQTMSQQSELVQEISRLNEIKVAAENAIETGNFNYESLNGLLNSDNASKVHEFQLQNYGKSVSKLNWPVMPKRGISAFFRNSGDGYQATFGVQHSAIDIPINQGSPVYAPADGVVYIAKDNGYGYSYIILSHAGGISTTYGHISNILVEAGQYVPSGAIIGLSGGMPGTKGAGYMTTGPHLHFEVRHNGMYVDPINYLPIEVLTEDQIIDKYRDMWEAAILRAKEKDLAIER